MNNKLSVIIPARNEEFLQKTIECVLDSAVEEIEVIAVCDGYWADPPINDDPRVRIIHNTESRGQRQSINDGVRISTGKYIMKLDAHCNVAKGFDKVLKEDCKYEWTMIPRMYNLNIKTFEPKLHKRTDYMYISSMTADKPFRATYYGSKQPKNKKEIDETMCCMGPCFFMHKDRFWELGGCDEGHGGWGQQGIEVACKAWLSGGKLMVNKKTWFAHWFRGGGVPEGFKKGFPYSLKQGRVNVARKHSQDLWLNNKWDKKVRDFQWLVDRFNPPNYADTTIIYYTDDTVEEPLKSLVKANIKKSKLPVIELHNEGEERSHLQLFKNIQRGLKLAKTKYVATAEHDCLYPKEHFKFTPPRDDTFYYDSNHYFGVMKRGQYHKPYRERKALSGLVCDKKLLSKAVDKRIEFLESGGEIIRGVLGACEFGVRDDDYKSESFYSKVPYIDIRHGGNFSGYRRGKNRVTTLEHWGEFSKLFGQTPPPGSWYQEATINGVKMPTRRRGDTNKKRWKKFIKPLVKSGSGQFTDLGCNAGFYCRKMIDLGYKATGVERDDGFLAHARFWEENEPKGTKIVKSDINDYKLVCSQYVLMANIHYWLTPENLNKLKEQLDSKALNVILIGRYKTLARHASPCNLEFLRELFKDWEEIHVIHDKKHFSVHFKNPKLSEADVDEITFYQGFMKSRRFLPTFNEFIDLVLSGKKFDAKKTSYYKYFIWRKFRNKDRLLKRHTELIKSMRDEGMREPITLGRIINGKQDNNILKDGDHRLIVAKKLGIKKLICNISQK